MADVVGMAAVVLVVTSELLRLQAVLAFAVLAHIVPPKNKTKTMTIWGKNKNLIKIHK